MRKLFGGGDKNATEQVVQQDAKSTQETAVSNDALLKQADLGKEENQGSWLSRAWGGMKDLGSSMGSGAKNGAVTGGMMGALPGLGVGAAAVAASPDDKKKWGGIGGGIMGGLLALPGALAGGVLGAAAGMAKGAFDHMTTDEKAILEKTEGVSNYHVMMEQFAHVYAYGKGDMKTLDMWGYELSSEFEDKNSGFRVIGLKPKDAAAVDPDGQALKPVVAFRGTANKGGALDDLNREGIGTFQFSRNEKEIKNTFGKVGGSADVTGHSLGGALAQLSAARLGGMVRDIITFQAAGINEEDAAKVDAGEHKATHYRTAGDLVHSGGEAFAAGEVVQFDHKGIDSALSHMTFPLAELNALRGKHGAPSVEGTRSGADNWVIGEKGDYHNGHWETEEGQTKSNLHDVDHHEDVSKAPNSAIVSMIGGRKNANHIMDGIANLTGAAERQEDFAAAWKEIRSVCGNIMTADETSDIRSQVVDVILKYDVPPRDHGKFISQAEALMLDVLETRVAVAKDGPQMA